MSDIEALISAQLDGELDDDGHRRLEEWLAADPQHQRRYLLAVAEHRALRERLAADRAQRTTGARRAQRRPTILRFVPALVAATLAFALGIWWSSSRRSHDDETPVGPPQPTFVATVTATAGARIDHGDAAEAAATGSTIPDGARVAATGTTTLELRDGTRLVLDPGTTIASLHAQQVDIEAGHLAAEVAPQHVERPMTFGTPECQTVVIGTSLAVSRSGSETQVEVTHGAVAVMRGVGGSDRVTVRAGQRTLATPELPLAVAAIGAPYGSTYSVGDGMAYADLAVLPALKPGDVVEIHAGTHRGAHSFRASGTALRPIVIRGVGAEPPLIDGDGVDVSGVGETPRALVQIQGDHYLVEHLAFANARNGENSAGIRCLGARHVVIRGCRIARCDDGIMAGDDVDDLLIEDCDVGWTGTAQRDGYCHGIYIGGARAVVRGCSIHDAQYGQAFKSSCPVLELIANRIVGADDGEISFIDGPGTETSSLTLSGNLVASKADRRGNTRRFIEVGTENGGIRGGTLTLRRNTFVAADPRVIFVDTVHSTMRVVADENIFAGSDRIAALGDGGMTGRRDWLPATAEVPAGLVDLLRGDQPGFVDAVHGDFHLAPTSPCLGLGAFSQQP